MSRPPRRGIYMEESQIQTNLAPDLSGGQGCESQPETPQAGEIQTAGEKNIKRRVIESTGRRELYIEMDGECIEIVNEFYPIYPYGNYVADWVKVCPGEMKAGSARNGWGGTGTESWGYVELSDDEYRRLYNSIEKIENVDGFEELKKTFREMIESRERKINDVIDKILNELVPELELNSNALEFLNNKEEAKEKIKEWIMEYVGV